MKNILFFVSGAVVAALILGIAGFAFAQSTPPPTQTASGSTAPWGYQGGNRGPGMMGGRLRQNQGSNYGPLHTYMLNAFAEALDMEPEALQTELQNGKTMWQVAEEKGLTQEEFTELAKNARSAALEQAVEDGVITQKQADWMTNRMNQALANGFTPGSGGCRGMGRFNRGWGGPGGWNQPTVTPAP